MNQIPEHPFSNPYGTPAGQQPQPTPYAQQPTPGAVPFTQPQQQPLPPVMDTTAVAQKPDDKQKKNRARKRFLYVLIWVDICLLILLVYEIIDLFIS